MNKRRPFGDVTEELIDHCWINKCIDFFGVCWFVRFVPFVAFLVMIHSSFAFSGWHFKSFEYFIAVLFSGTKINYKAKSNMFTLIIKHSHLLLNIITHYRFLLRKNSLFILI